MLSEKLKSLRKSRKITQAELAAQFDVSQQAIAKWESGRATPEPRTLARLAEFFSVSADYLLDMAGSLTPAGDFSGVKIIGTVKTGYGALAIEEDYGYAPANVKYPEQYRYLMVKGDSMAPFIQEGDLALVRIQPSLNSGELGVFIYKDEEATLKKYHNHGGRVLLEPFNPDYEPLIIENSDLEELIIFGKVVETHRSW